MFVADLFKSRCLLEAENLFSALVMRAGIVVKVTPAERRRLETIFCRSQRAAEACVAGRSRRKVEARLVVLDSRADRYRSSWRLRRYSIVLVALSPACP
jgi:hypothetical protein